ncbi:putative peptide-methionine (S)-S-oxide reductase [Helianthus debilis subsp. tardiflorus]
MPPHNNRYTTTIITIIMSWLSWLGLTTRTSTDHSPLAQSPDADLPASGQQFAQFGAGCFWGVELAFQRVPGVTKTEVGYSQGFMHNPKYSDVCSGTTKHSEVV